MLTIKNKYQEVGYRSVTRQGEFYVTYLLGAP